METRGKKERKKERSKEKKKERKKWGTAGKWLYNKYLERERKQYFQDRSCASDSTAVQVCANCPLRSECRCWFLLSPSWCIPSAKSTYEECWLCCCFADLATCELRTFGMHRSWWGPDPRTVEGQTDFDVIIGQCVVSDKTLACAILVRRKTLSDGEVRVCLLP